MNYQMIQFDGTGNPTVTRSLKAKSSEMAILGFKKLGYEGRWLLLNRNTDAMEGIEI
jgi:hypothetical protein